MMDESRSQRCALWPPPVSNNWNRRQEFQNRRRFYPKKKRFAPFAPRNTSSFIIRSKRSGGIASLVSPCPVTPAVLPTPMFSPSREVLVDMAREEWGLDGYGSMKGLIRVRSEAGEEGGDFSRFEMIYTYRSEHSSVLEKRVDDQEMHIVQLEEENSSFKERLFSMETELEDLRRRVQILENFQEESGSVSGGEVSSERSVGHGEAETGVGNSFNSNNG